MAEPQATILRHMFAVFLYCLFLLPPLAQAQFNYTTNGGVVAITGYTGTNGSVTIPSSIVGLPVTIIANFAFYQRTVLTNVTIPDSVTNIGSAAFFNCSRMTNVTLSTNLSTIGMGAFEGCSGLVSVVIPNNVTSMGSSAFANCRKLNSIILSSNLITLGSSAFSQCSSLTNATIPNGVRSIGSGAFYRCGSLISIVVSDAVTNIGPTAFSSCTNLAGITMGTNVTIIGTSAFQYCYSLTNLTIPDSVTSLGNYAFSFCTNLAQITIGTNTGSIGSYAFQRCVSLVNITIPASVTNIGTLAFANCIGLTAIAVAPNNPAYSSVNGALLNLDQTTLIQYPIGNAAQTFELPSTVTNILDGAFQDCIPLSSVTIPDGVSRLPNNVFRGCVGLTNVSIPDSVSIIPPGAFYGCSNLFAITIPNSVTNIGDGAFQGCVGLANVALPDGVARIPNNTFRGCAALTSISIPNRVTDVGNSAFLGCSSLTNATIGNSVTNIQASAFSGCSSLTSVSMGYIIYTIGNEAFRDCSSLTAIYFYADFPYSVSTNAFPNVPATAYYLPGATRWSTNLAGLPTAIWNPFTYVTSPNTTNNEVIITACTNPLVAAVTVSNTIAGRRVVGIGAEAFNDCTNLVSITIPAGVTAIGSNAFASCSNLIDIYFEGNAPTADLPVFAAAPKATIYFRPGTTGWSSTFDELPTALWIKFDRWVHDGMVEIGAYTDSVSDVIIPRTLRGLPVTGIGLGAFYSSPITSVTIPDSVTYIGNLAFSSCGQLTRVTLPNSITYLSWWGFANCGNLTNITIPASVHTIVNYAFYGTGLRTVYFEGNAPGIHPGGEDPQKAFAWCPVTAYYLPGTTGWTEFLSLAGIPGQLWNPHIQTTDDNFGLQSNQFGFNITGTTNIPIVVEATTNLTSGSWSPIQSCTLTNGSIFFSDPDWTNHPSRLYRIRSP